jgi:hypothetical protein
MFDGACRRLFAICHRPSKVECLMLLCRPFFIYFFISIYLFPFIPSFRCYLFICAQVFCSIVSPNYRPDKHKKRPDGDCVLYATQRVCAAQRESAEQLNRPTIVVGVLEHFLSSSFDILHRTMMMISARARDSVKSHQRELPTCRQGNNWQRLLKQR